MRRSNVLSLPFSKVSLHLGLQFQNMNSFSKQDETCAEYSTIKAPVRLRCNEAKLPSLKLKTWPKQLPMPFRS
jgi:hypothetical protein